MVKKCVKPFKRQPLKMDKYPQTICRQHPTNCLILSDHFVSLVLKGLIDNCEYEQKVSNFYTFDLAFNCLLLDVLN